MMEAVAALGLPALQKHAYDPYSGEFLPCTQCFLNGGDEAPAQRGIDMRSWFDETEEDGGLLVATVHWGAKSEGARNRFFIADLIHGGAIETVLHEAMLEVLKLVQDPEVRCVPTVGEVRAAVL